MPRVSVSMPFFNSRPFLAEAIETVRAQAGPTWELLLVDDGASDGSSDVARWYAEREPSRIRLFSHPGGTNRGPGASHNLALRHARGEYFAILDSDDVWMPYTLARRVELLDGAPGVGLVYGNTEYWYSWSDTPADATRDYVPALGVPAGMPLPPQPLLAMFVSRRAAVPCTCSILVRRSLAEHVGGVEESLRTFEDQAFYTKLLLAAPFMAVDECWARYRRHPVSSCSVVRRSGRAGEHGLAFLAWLEGYLDAAGIDAPDVRRALRATRWRYQYPAAARRLTVTADLLRRAFGGQAAFRRPRRRVEPARRA